MMSGARGCFNCGGCAWRFRVVRLAFSPVTLVVGDEDHVYLAISPTPPSILSTLSCVLSGADVDRCVLFFAFHIVPMTNCDRRKKKNRHANPMNDFDP
ncbi:hypothetical protein L210DRAFT_3573777 [Boletus edulis BED1]|uniref:Uncharacterized protein n=1 Tax=Boletus edulis BED1 TaxID=1328754 RepID=A0AAD4BDY4_BOLED|nr:hypothetical protein L210DRAFT_3573777 [Boletus edulis BED1]